MEEKGNGSCSKFVLEIKARKNGLAEGINHRAKIRTSRKLGFRFLSSFRISFEPATCHRAFSLLSLTFLRVQTSAESCFPSAPLVQLFSSTLLSYNCSQVSRQQNISKPRSFHYKANATFEIARNYATEIKDICGETNRVDLWQTLIIYFSANF